LVVVVLLLAMLVVLLAIALVLVLMLVVMLVLPLVLVLVPVLVTQVLVVVVVVVLPVLGVPIEDNRHVASTELGVPVNAAVDPPNVNMSPSGVRTALCAVRFPGLARAVVTVVISDQVGVYASTSMTQRSSRLPPALTPPQIHSRPVVVSTAEQSARSGGFAPG